MSKLRTMSQKKAEFALDKALINKDNKKFKPFSAGVPAMILKNGFGQSLAFWVAKGKDEHMAMFDIVVNWLKRNGFTKSTEKTEFLREISTMDQKQYLLCQQEALKLLEWVKRFANAEL